MLTPVYDGHFSGFWLTIQHTLLLGEDLSPSLPRSEVLKAGVRMNRQTLFIVGTFVIGFGLGFFLKSALPQPRSKIDAEWHQQFSEDMDHQRIMEFSESFTTVKSEERGRRYRTVQTA